MIAYKISHTASSLPDEPEFGRDFSAHSHIDEYEQYRGAKDRCFSGIGVVQKTATD
jgi:hypothetical protein